MSTAEAAWIPRWSSFCLHFGVSHGGTLGSGSEGVGWEDSLTDEVSPARSWAAAAAAEVALARGSLAAHSSPSEKGRMGFSTTAAPSASLSGAPSLPTLSAASNEPAPSAEASPPAWCFQTMSQFPTCSTYTLRKLGT